MSNNLSTDKLAAVLTSKKFLIEVIVPVHLRACQWTNEILNSKYLRRAILHCQTRPQAAE